VSLQANNKEKILELYQEVTNEIVSEPIYENEIDSINTWSDDQMLGIILLMNANKKRYSSLLVDLHNDFVMGNNNYPTTFTEAFSLLLNYRKERFFKGKDTVGGRGREDEDGFSFA